MASGDSFACSASSASAPPRLGGWASIESVKLYVDPFVVPHLYSFLVFGPWLRKSLDAVIAAHRQVRSS